MEAHFNGAYGYDWTLFSHEELSIEFKEAASNATRAAVTFDVIPEEHWSVPAWIDLHRYESRHSCRGHGGGAYHHKTRWNAGLFAREPRLRFYDWYWKVEPGVSIAHDFKFDVFRTMHSERYHFGLNSFPTISPEASQVLLESVTQFMDEHREIVWPTANIAWLNTSNTQRHAIAKSTQPTQCSLETPFELGSLHTFRSPEYIKFFNHLDSLGEFYYNHIGDVPIRSIGATLFVPERWVWLLPDTECEVGEYCAPEFNLGQVSFLASINGGEIFGWDEDYVRFVKNNLVLWVQRWDAILEDFRRQEEVPSPPLGHTTLDERNFEPFWEWHMKIFLFKEWVRTWNSIHLDQELEPFEKQHEEPHTTDVPAERKSLLGIVEEMLIKPRINTYRIYADELGRS
ncbi:glycosyltransferase family 15 protein [Sodiomyces alcalophilus JCM 7366]|uniref:glycosyltransferase family 15 protein n=1 Tax=Sodiomyces alcalophilus JCM 7366 TaxID=591952 RepID=UPI0039B6E078